MFVVGSLAVFLDSTAGGRVVAAFTRVWLEGFGYSEGRVWVASSDAGSTF